jgi:DNA-binding Lrp family transcriptional regulator
MWKFLQSEMLVILALTEDANRTDAEIADIYDLKKGTVSSVRRRLLEAGAVHYAYVPAFNRLGCEMLGFHYGSTDPAVRSDTKANNYMEFCNRTPQVYFSLIGGNSIVLFTALRNATEFEAFIQHHNRFFLGHKRSSRAKLTSAVFPYGLSKGTYVPQYAALVHDYFQLDVPPPKRQPIAAVEVNPAELSQTEKATMVNMVADPDASDREIAAAVRLSRQAITRIRNRLTDDGILTKICIPRLYRWGFEICAVAHPKFNLDVPWEKRLRSQPKRVMEQTFYSVSKADEAIAIYMISKFTRYSEQLESILPWYHKAKAFDEELEVVLFSLERSTELRNFDYAPAVRHICTPGPRQLDAALRDNV